MLESGRVWLSALEIGITCTQLTSYKDRADHRDLWMHRIPNSRQKSLVR